ncbi:MAG: hypothetical protein Q9167_007461, partial [Letrouitia subvulpina]
MGSAFPTGFGERLMAIHRIDLYNELLKLALEGTDNPALLRLGIAVEDVDTTDGSLFLSDGTKCHADLIVGADGTHSATRRSVLKSKDQPAMTGMSAFRFLVPTDRIENEASLCGLYEWKSSGTTIFVDTSDKTVELKVFKLTSSRGEVQNVVGIHPTRSHNGAETDLKAALLDEFRNFRSDILRLLELAEEVKCWRLAYYEPFPTWLSEKTVLIGDAAHPMLPFGGQAANQAIKDGGALGLLPTGVNNDAEIPQRLRIFENLKKNRTSIIQIPSSVRIGREREVERKLRPFAQSASE